jgi:putative PIN family toxin of toxin-antitoxin system
VSDALLTELGRALAYPKLRKRVTEAEAAEFLGLLRDSAAVVPDLASSRHASSDPHDDYLLALAEDARAVLVSGDRHLLALADELPIQTAREFLVALEGA